MTISTLVASVAAGLFAGASLYVTLVEHPAWVECGPALAIKHFGPSARRAGVMQGLLAVIGLVAGVTAWGQGSGSGWLVGGLLLAALVPFTLIIVARTNRRLLDPGLNPGSGEARDLLTRWGRLHAVRTVVGVVAFAIFVAMLVRSGAGG
jgi:uncharacterized membrane protein